MEACKSVYKFLRGKYGRQCTAPLTGQDARALHAFVHLVELYSVSDAPGEQCALEAMRATAQAMQPHTRWIAREAVALGADWNGRERLWRRLFPDDPACARGAAYCDGCGAVMEIRAGSDAVCPACRGVKPPKGDA